MALNTSHQLKYGRGIYSHEFGYWSILSLQQYLLSVEKLFMIFSLVNELSSVDSFPFGFALATEKRFHL